jgi:tryptophan-rich sensory protein
MAACIVAGSSGAVYVRGELDDWYKELKKPSFNPPNYLFAPVWTLLYALMGAALGMVLNAGWKTPGVPLATILFCAQFALNMLWTPLFFGMHKTGAALADLAALWLLLAATICAFARISSTAAWLLVPYICWISFAGALNFAVWKLNPPEPEQ